MSTKQILSQTLIIMNEMLWAVVNLMRYLKEHGILIPNEIQEPIESAVTRVVAAQTIASNQN